MARIDVTQDRINQGGRISVQVGGKSYGENSRPASRTWDSAPSILGFINSSSSGLTE